MGGDVTGTLLCFGLGYSARTLAERLAARGWEIRGTTRRPDKADAWPRAAGACSRSTASGRCRPRPSPASPTP